MKGLLADWDELNIIQSESGGGGGGSADALLGSMGDIWGLADYTYDFLDGVEQRTTEITTMLSEWWADWGPTVKGFLAGLGTFIGLSAIGGIISKFSKLSKGGKIALGIAGIVAGFKTLEGTFAEMISQGAGWDDYWAQIRIGALELVGGGALIGGTIGGPIGAVIGGLAGIAAGFGAYIEAGKKVQRQRLGQEFRNLFGDVHLAKEEVQALVRALYETDYDRTVSLQLEGFEAANTALANARTALDDLTKQAWLVRMGVNRGADNKEVFLSEVSTAVSELQTWVNEGAYALSIPLAPGTETEGETQPGDLSYFVTYTNTYLADLGTQAAEHFNAAFEGELFDINEFNLAMRAVEKLGRIQQAIDTAQSEAEHRSMIRSWDLTDLDYDTAMEYINQSKEFAQSQIQAVQDILDSRYAFYSGQLELANIMLEDDPTNEALKAERDRLQGIVVNFWDEKENDLLVTANARINDINLQQENDTIKILKARIEHMFDNIVPEIDVKSATFTSSFDAIENYMKQYASNYKTFASRTFNELPDEMKDSMTLLMDAEKRMAESWEKEIYSGKVTSQANPVPVLPEEAIQNLNEYKEYMALMGDAAATQYMMGREFAKDALFIRRLGTDIFPERLIRDDFGEGFINSLQIAQDDIGKWYIQFADGQTQYISDLSDSMLKNLETMGLDLQPLIDNLNSLYTSIADAGMNALLLAVKAGLGIRRIRPGETFPMPEVQIPVDVEPVVSAEELAPVIEQELPEVQVQVEIEPIVAPIEEVEAPSADLIDFLSVEDAAAASLQGILSYYNSAMQDASIAELAPVVDEQIPIDVEPIVSPDEVTSAVRRIYPKVEVPVEAELGTLTGAQIGSLIGDYYEEKAALYPNRWNNEEEARNFLQSLTEGSDSVAQEDFIKRYGYETYREVFDPYRLYNALTYDGFLYALRTLSLNEILPDDEYWRRLIISELKSDVPVYYDDYEYVYDDDGHRNSINTGGYTRGFTNSPNSKVTNGIQVPKEEYHTFMEQSPKLYIEDMPDVARENLITIYTEGVPHPEKSNELADLMEFLSYVESKEVVLPAIDTSAAIASLQALLSYYYSVMSIIGGLSIGAALTGGVLAGRKINAPLSTPIYTIPTYAGGGLPKEGQLFLANEQGPEIVGQFGGGTGVANGDQIIEGIAGGVERANSRLERKMDEFISLARQLVAKDNRVVLQPSAALGKVNQRSAEMYARGRG